MDGNNMNIQRKFTAIQIGSKKVYRTVEPTFEFGGISGPYYNEEHPQIEFDTEEAAIEWAYKESSYSTWMIIPVINFK